MSDFEGSPLGFLSAALPSIDQQHQPNHGSGEQPRPQPHAQLPAHRGVADDPAHPGQTYVIADGQSQFSQVMI